jgi:hypothetical protein
MIVLALVKLSKTLYSYYNFHKFFEQKLKYYTLNQSFSIYLKIRIFVSHYYDLERDSERNGSIEKLYRYLLSK